MFGVLWGKSKAEGSMNLLLQHLLDAAAVGECLWDRYLAPTVREKLDASAGGRGRAFFAWLCAIHDVGKATPAFQNKEPGLASVVQAIGLTWRPLSPEAKRWHHSCAGAVIVDRVLSDVGWEPEAVAFVWPMVAGHHGLIPDDSILTSTSLSRDRAQGGSHWLPSQDALMYAVAAVLDVDLAEWAPVRPLSRSTQLAVSGLVIMADWIASGRGFPGVSDISRVSIGLARRRAAEAMDRLRVRGGWSSRPYRRVPDLVLERFGRVSRPSQTAAIGIAERMPGPGLVIIEAPMGEGKTEGALAVTEILAWRFGADGIFLGMPTQATCDPMYTRVRQWSSSIEDGVAVGLLHGKRRFNKEWAALRDLAFGGVDEDGQDEYGCDDIFGSAGTGQRAADAVAAEWFLGPKRGLLMPLTVGTIDQLLHAATRTKHVMLRHAGLAGRVVVLDEVHAYDVYTSQFLFEALRWLAGAGVPTVLLSATLPAGMRADLERAWVQGASGRQQVSVDEPDSAGGYPVIRSVVVVDGRVQVDVAATAPWRPSVDVRVEVLDANPADDTRAVVALLADRLREGGCALVIRNTVRRAQQTYQALAPVFGGDVRLLHARLTAGERADRTERALRALGAPDDDRVERPQRLIVVATQVAEQSFDVDADILVTDLAPIDLLLQRIGRVHRHERPESARPGPLRLPAAVVTGVRTRPGEAPVFPRGSERIYGRYPLLRAAALTVDAAGGAGWSIPADVPDLVDRGYGADECVPDAWRSAVDGARVEWTAATGIRRSRAEPFLLAGPGKLGLANLAGLHDKATGELPDDDAVSAVVRDGPESVEVVVVRRTDEGYLTLAGRRLGVNGEAVSDPDIANEVIEATLRLPGDEGLTAAVKAELRPLAGWATDSWLRHARALVLDADNHATVSGHALTYDHDLGLLWQRPTRGRR
ncbi:CRISPR-associated helicase Cas3' [Micromonospora sp. LOL_023]|uniref:CRISPR-associated helicase Cas3' n=1 Tax=Micromonospora sp. LOL_023 TaxID=3345418 RepID=UPI003A85DF96